MIRRTLVFPVLLSSISFASVSHAALSEMSVFADALNASYLSYEDGSQNDVDGDSFGQFFPEGSDFESDWIGVVDTQTSLGAQSAYSKSTSTLNTSSTGFAYQATTSFGSDLGSNGLGSASNAFLFFNGSLVFDRDTEIEVYFRVDFERSDTLYLYGAIEISGLENAPTERLVVEGSSSAGYVSTRYRAIAPEGAFIRLQVDIDGETDTDFGNPEQYSGSFTVTTIVRVVPAPGSAGTLAGVGLFTARRRRGSGVSR